MALAAVLLTGGLLTGGLPPATAGMALDLPGPQPAAGPQGSFANTLTFTVSSVTPAVVTSTGGNSVAIRGTVTNAAATPVTDLIYRMQRGDRLTNAAAVSKEIDDPGQPEAVIAGDWASLGARIEPHRSIPFGVAAPIIGATSGSLRIDQPGVYPLMVNVNGVIDVQGVPTEVRLGELHLLVTVTSLPAAVAGPGTRGPSTAGPKPATAAIRTSVPVGLMWPIVSRPHRGVGGVFLDESLAGEIAAGGALTERLDALAASGMPSQNVTLTVDPMLLDELQAMTAGYRVQAPGTVQAPLSRAPATTASGTAATIGTASGTASGTAIGTAASIGTAIGTAATIGTATARATAISGSSPPSGPPLGTGTAGQTALTAAAGGTSRGSAGESDTVAGTGAAAASAFLQRLRQLAAQTTVLVLPYSNPDAVALTRAGSGSTLKSLAATGRSIAARILRRPDLATTVALPPDALADPATLDSYRAAGYTSVVLSGSGVTGATGTGLGRVRAGKAGSLPAVLDDSTLRPMLDDLLVPTKGSTGGQSLNSAVAIIGQHAFDGDRRPFLRVPDRTVDTAGLDDLGAAIRALAADGAVGPASPARLAATAPSAITATAVFPAASDADLLPPDYLRQLSTVQADLASLTGATSAAATTPPGAEPQPTPNTVGTTLLRSLGAALLPLGSASLRADRSPAAAVLSTVSGTMAAIRGGVTILPTQGSYTLASSDSPLVLTVQNRLPYPVRVKIAIGGGQQAGLIADLPESVLLGADSTQQLNIPTNVSRAGSFVIYAQLMGLDGRAWNSVVPLRIRSSAYGALTIILISVAGGVLLLMVALRIGQRLRARRAGPAAAEQDGGARQEPTGPAAGSITASANEPAGDGLDTEVGDTSANQSPDDRGRSDHGLDGHLAGSHLPASHVPGSHVPGSQPMAGGSRRTEGGTR